MFKSVFIRSASLGWSCASLLHRVKSHLISPVRLPTRVISVGNLQAGGAGKTPLVAQIANEAKDRGLSVWILIRGYKGQWEKKGGWIPPVGSKAKVEVALCGDEAALLHDLCPHAMIGVGANRVRNYLSLVGETGKHPDLVILDDGFQNRTIQKDLEILALTSYQPWEVVFRDFGWAVSRAHLLVWTKGKTKPQTLDRPWIQVKYRLPSPHGPIWMVTGIADPQSARQLAVESGYQISRFLPFSDHRTYRRSQVRGLIEEAARSGCQVAITGKDWVKWRELGVQASEVRVLEPKLEMTKEGQETWSRILWGS